MSAPPPSDPGSEVGYRHVDVFADAPYHGNGLVVVFCATLDVAAERLRLVAQEMRQFETIFLGPVAVDRATVESRIFTVEEELPFAGHPVVGAAAALHERQAPEALRAEWRFVIDDRPVRVISVRDNDYFTATMDQGRAQTTAPLPDSVRD